MRVGLGREGEGGAYWAVLICPPPVYILPSWSSPVAREGHEGAQLRVDAPAAGGHRGGKGLVENDGGVPLGREVNHRGDSRVARLA